MIGTKTTVPTVRQVRIDRCVKAALILVGVALLLPGIFAIALLTPLLAGETAPAVILWLAAGGFAVAAGGIWLIRHTLRNR